LIVDGENAENFVMFCKWLCSMMLGKKNIFNFFYFFVGVGGKWGEKGESDGRREMKRSRFYPDESGRGEGCLRWGGFFDFVRQRWRRKVNDVDAQKP